MADRRPESWIPLRPKPAVAVVFMIGPIVMIPTMTSTIVSAWNERALDTERLNLQQNRPEAIESSAAW